MYIFYSSDIFWIGWFSKIGLASIGTAALGGRQQIPNMIHRFILSYPLCRANRANSPKTLSIAVIKSVAVQHI